MLETVFFKLTWFNEPFTPMPKSFLSQVPTRHLALNKFFKPETFTRKKFFGGKWKPVFLTPIMLPFFVSLLGRNVWSNIAFDRIVLAIILLLFLSLWISKAWPSFLILLLPLSLAACAYHNYWITVKGRVSFVLFVSRRNELLKISSQSWASSAFAASQHQITFHN